MSRKQPININIKKEMTIHPDLVFESKVIKSGNGAVIHAYKKYLGKKVTVLVHSTDESFEDDMSSASNEGWERV